MTQHGSVRLSSVSRRRFLQLVGIGGGASILAACQPATLVEAPRPSPTANPDAVINYAISAEPLNLDPGAAGSAQVRQIQGALFDRLIKLGPDLTPQPGLATSWTTSPDGLKWTFKLRPNVVFHDGEPLDAAAVKFTIERILDPKLSLQAIRFFQPVVKSVNAPTADTVEFNLLKPFAPMLSLAAVIDGGIVSPKAVQRLGADFARQPVGSGPFVFKQWTSGQRIVIERNEKYWGAPAKSKQIVFLPVTQDSTRVAMVETGQADLAQYIPPSEMKRLATDSKYQVLQPDALEVRTLKLNMLDERMKDVRVRQALNYAIDRAAIVATVLEGAGVGASGPVPTGVAGALQTPKYGYDAAMAKKLLADAGFAGGFKLDLAFTPGGTGSGQKEIMEAIQAQLRAVGVDVTLMSLDTAAFNSYRALTATSPAGLKKGMISHGQTLSYPDPSPLRSVYHSSAWPPAGSNYGFYKNDRADTLWDQGDIEVDATKRRAIYQELQTLIVNDAPAIFLYQQRWLYLASKGLRGLVLPPTETIDFSAVQKD